MKKNMHRISKNEDVKCLSPQNTMERCLCGILFISAFLALRSVFCHAVFIYIFHFLGASSYRPRRRGVASFFVVVFVPALRLFVFSLMMSPDFMDSFRRAVRSFNFNWISTCDGPFRFPSAPEWKQRICKKTTRLFANTLWLLARIIYISIFSVAATCQRCRKSFLFVIFASIIFLNFIFGIRQHD